MSKAMSVDVYEPQYWSYMAAVMSDRLRGAVASKRVEGDDLPLGVYRDSQRFFQLVLDATEGRPPKNPPASVNAYVLAADVVRSQSESKDRTGVAFRLKQYAQFVTGLSNTRDLKPEEVRLAEELGQFFDELHREAEAAEYERIVDFESAPTRLK